LIVQAPARICCIQAEPSGATVAILKVTATALAGRKINTANNRQLRALNIISTPFNIYMTI
jgi:hypothetical protein